jgi:hypothetical protein
MSKRKGELLGKTVSTVFRRPPLNQASTGSIANASNKAGNTFSNFFGPFVDNRYTPQTNQRQINMANNRGYFTDDSTGLINYNDPRGLNQFTVGKKNIFNDPVTKAKFLSDDVYYTTNDIEVLKGIKKVGDVKDKKRGIASIFTSRENPEVPVIGPLNKDMYEPYKSGGKELKYQVLKKNAIDANHPYMDDKRMFQSRANLPESFLPYVSKPSFLSTGFRNKSYHRYYESQLDNIMNAPFDAKANIGKYDLIKKYKEGKISKGNFLMAQEAIDSKVKNITRDMRKLGLESMMYDSSKNKMKYFGGLYDNMARLYNDMPDDYFLRGYKPELLNAKTHKSKLGFDQPSKMFRKDKDGNLVPKDSKEAVSIGQGQWWSDRGRDNYGDYYRTIAPYMKNKGSKYNFNMGGLASLLGNKALQRMAQLLSPKQFKMLTDTKFKGTNPMNSPKNIRQMKLDNYLKDKYSATTNYPYKKSSVPGPRSSGGR